MKNDHIAKTIDVYNRNAKQYDMQADTHGPTSERKMFASLLLNGAAVLDLGCGSGRDALYFVQHEFRVTGVDLSKNLLALAKEKVPEATFLLQDMRHLQLFNNSFDGIWACASIMHLKRDEIPEVLRSLSNLLKQDGILFILVKEGLVKKKRLNQVCLTLRGFIHFFQKIR